MKQDREMSRDRATGELQRNDADADAIDAIAVTVSESATQKLEDTCEQLLNLLKEARREVGRPEDLRVNYEILLLLVSMLR